MINFLTEYVETYQINLEALSELIKITMIMLLIITIVLIIFFIAFFLMTVAIHNKLDELIELSKDISGYEEE